jgi:large subunit ribosomal protein L23
MGFLDRFKKQKEQEVEKATPATSGVKEIAEPSLSPKHVSVRGASAQERQHTTVVREELVEALLRPWVTEKTAVLASMGHYVFLVQPDATRVAVRRAVQALYGVRPMDVRMQNMRAESIRFGRRLGKRKAWKKAIVSLPKGTSIDVNVGV